VTCTNLRHRKEVTDAWCEERFNFFFCRVISQIRCGSILFEVSVSRRIRRTHARTQRTGDQLVAAATTYTKHTHKYKKRTTMPLVGFEISIPAIGWM